MKTCSIDGCTGAIKARGYCGKHYQRLRRWNDVNFTAYSTSEEINASIELGAATESPECLFWPHATASSGYGYVWFDGKGQPVQRVICGIAHGPAPSPEHESAHSCGSGHLGCINRNHIRWATPTENANDRVVHGNSGKGIPKEYCRGTQNNLAKLTDEKVREIRRLGLSLSQSEIARTHGLHHSTIGRILQRKTWGWLK